MRYSYIFIQHTDQTLQRNTLQQDINTVITTRQHHYDTRAVKYLAHEPTHTRVPNTKKDSTLGVNDGNKAESIQN